MTLVIMGVVLTMGILLTIAYVADTSEAMSIINALFLPVVLGLTLVWCSFDDGRVDWCSGLSDAPYISPLRHSAAKLRRDAGESVETVSAFLDHSSLAVTTTYLRRLEGVEDHSWERVAEAIGIE